MGLSVWPLTQRIVANGPKDNLRTLLDDAVHGPDDAQRGIALGVVRQPLEVNVRRYERRVADLLLRHLQNGQHSLQRRLIPIVIGQQHQSAYRAVAPRRIANRLTVTRWLLPAPGLTPAQAEQPQPQQQQQLQLPLAQTAISHTWLLPLPGAGCAASNDSK